MVKKAMILAAGIGSRLKTLTANQPKALVEVGGIPMLERQIVKLKNEGVEEFMINIHHHGNKVLEFLKRHNNFGVPIHISDERNKLLDTGGAILKAASFFEGDNPVLVQNVDIISEVDLPMLESYHFKQKALCTLCIRNRTSGRGLLFDKNMLLKGWVNHEKKMEKWVDEKVSGLTTFAFSGIYLVKPTFPSMISFKSKFSIIDVWLQLAKTQRIIGYNDLSENWFDIGTPEKIKKAENYFNS